MSITEFVGELDERARKELATPVEIVDAETVPAEHDMFVEARKWLRIEDVLVVAADLKGSTRLGFGSYANTSARLYEAVTSHLVRAMDRFDPAFMDIQGDGLFALFDGERRHERGLCAAVTVATFSRSLEDRIEAQFRDSFPDTGLKIGMDVHRLVVKKVGIRGTNEPVWAGRTVNWATKAAQHADKHQVVATRRVFQRFEDNTWITHSCGCRSYGIPTKLWSPTRVHKLPDTESECMVLDSFWCDTHGDETCAAILAGQTSRDDVSTGVLA